MGVRVIHMILLLAILSGIGTLFAAQHSQETLDALQNQRITIVERTSADNTAAIGALAKEMASLRSSLDRFTGIGIGIGTALTALQGLLVILTMRNGKRG